MLAGDFLFAQASWGLANLENIEVRSGKNLLTSRKWLSPQQNHLFHVMDGFD